MVTRVSVWEPEAMELPWTESPFFEELLAASELDREQRELARRYSEQGYLVFDPEIPPGTLDRLVEALRGRYISMQHGYDSRIQDAELPEVRSVATAPRVMEMLRMLYRREPIPFQTLNFELGTQQAIHNDAIHFHSIPERYMCGVWVALEDVDHENGPVFYYPGSHRLPVYEMPDMGLAPSTESYPLYEQALDRLMRANGLEPEELHLRRGEAMIWAANLCHGGSPVIDAERTRLSQVTHYFFESCLYYSPQGTDLVRGRLQLRDVRNLGTGEMVAHHYRGEVVHRPNEPGSTPIQLGAAEEERPPSRLRAAWWRARGKLRSMLGG